jgi:hypothetical protein
MFIARGPQPIRAQRSPIGLRGRLPAFAGFFCALLFAGRLVAVDRINEINSAANTTPGFSLAEVLPAGRWRQVENSVDRALAWLATQQNPDGSFSTIGPAEPATTSLCIMAFLSRGHQPGAGPHGDRLNRAIDYVLACQLPDGLLSKLPPGPAYVNRQPSHTAYYNHAITGLMLGEVYGQVTGARAKGVKQAIAKALTLTRAVQTRPKSPNDRGGWRYPHGDYPIEADVSVTGWHVMFLRSAKNAEFDVPKEWMDEATAYVNRCWDPRTGMFFYGLPGNMYGGTRGTTGAGIVSLSLGGQHQTAPATAAGDWLLAHPFRQYGETFGTRNKFIYDTYYCSQAAAQLGGRYWAGIFPRIVDVLLSAQARDGSWPPESAMIGFGAPLTTAMAVLSLTPPYQLLPVYQR